MLLSSKACDSNKLAACSFAAAMAYPWMLTAADDWGRFRCEGRALLFKVFPRRKDVKEEDIDGWLTEYIAKGLLAVYEHDGITYGEWTNWQGVRPSQRRFRRCPSPAWANTSSNPTAEVAGEVDEYTREYPAGLPSVPSVPSATYPPTPADAGERGDEAETVASKPAGAVVAVTEPTPLPPSRRPERPRRRREERQAKGLDCPENREGVEDVNTILGKRLTHRDGTWGWFQRLRDAGHDRATWVRVLEAVRDGATQSAQWARDQGAPLDWILRPGTDKSAGFDRILTQIEAGQKPVSQAKQQAAQGIVGYVPETVEQIRARKMREAEEQERAMTATKGYPPDEYGEWPPDMDFSEEVKA